MRRWRISGFPRQRSGAAARDIAEDEIEGLIARQRRGIGYGAADSLGISVATKTGFGLGEAFCAYVGRRDLGRLETAGQDERLAAGSGTAIPYGPGVGRGHGRQFRHQTGAIVHLGQVSAVFSEETALFRLFLIGLADLQRGLAAIGGDPSLHQPLRMTEPFGEGGDRLEDALAGPLRHGQLAQDGVDHAGRMGLTGSAAQLDALAQNGVGGNAIEMQQLKGTHPQGQRDRLCQSLFGPLQQGSNARVERNLPAQHAHNEGRGEVAVLGGESIPSAESAAARRCGPLPSPTSVRISNAASLAGAILAGMLLAEEDFGPAERGRFAVVVCFEFEAFDWNNLCFIVPTARRS